MSKITIKETDALIFAIASSLGEQTLAGIVSGGIMGGGFRALGLDGDSSDKNDGPEVLFQIEDENGKFLNTDGKSGKIGTDGSQFRTMWTIEEEALTEQEVSLVYRNIEKINNRDVDNCEMSAEGEYILEINNKLVYTDADHKHPTISKVITFGSEYEDDIYI